MRSWASVLLKGSSTGIPCFIAVHIIVLHRGVFCFVLFCFTNWRQDPPSAKRLWLALLWWSGMNLQYLRGMPVFPFPISHKWSSLTTQFKVQKFTKVFPLLWALNSNFCLLELKNLLKVPFRVTATTFRIGNSKGNTGSNAQLIYWAPLLF